MKETPVQYNSHFPNRAIIAITDRCNSKCSFCDIWNIKNPEDLNLDLIDKLPATLKSVDVTGGEPFLHKDFESIIRKLLKRKCQVIVNTNGLCSLSRFESLWKGNGFGVRFSLDGISDRHDKLRGVPGNYNKVISNIEYLKSFGFTDIGLSCTFSDANIDQALPLYSLSKELGVKFTFVIVANSSIYYKKTNNNFAKVGQFTDVINGIMKRETVWYQPKSLGKAIFMNELKNFINGKVKTIRCPAGNTFFFMKPNGDIFACNMQNFYMGNLGADDFERIWFSMEAKKVRQKTCNCTTPCWTMCNAKSIILNRKLYYSLRFLRDNINDKIIRR